MVIAVSKNPIARISCSIGNYREKIITKRWRKGRHVCICHVCGEVLDSAKDKWSPEECGWKRLKDKYIYNPWICHSCLEHHDSVWIKRPGLSNI